VRVGNLQELVYKQGQAGVSKASVSIVFNNEDRSLSPIGYEEYDKITITREVCALLCASTPLNHSQPRFSR
jgi:structural maintenance of chromosome 2